MSTDREAELRRRLESFVDPWLKQSLGDAQAIAGVRVSGGAATAELVLGFPAADYAAELSDTLRAHAAGSLPWLESLDVQVTWNVAAHGRERNLPPIREIRNIVAVASGKGGVGKSTVAVNLALALGAQGARVGLLDADIYGPSQPRMLGLGGQRPSSPDGKSLQPLEAYGLEVMSIGFLIDEEQPMVWRGPMVTQALSQLLGDTRWSPLDYLIVDMPPGTGDIQLTLSQRVPVSGAIIVTTPQDIALLDARKGLRMFEKVSVPVLGIIENMSTHVCSKCGHEEHIFGSGGGARMAEQYGVELLGNLPLDIRIREQTDGGRPTVVAEPDGALARAYRESARRAAIRLAAPGAGARTFPTISVEDT
jgi:ATP-binding protein involved in chromosome partitioning